MKNFIWNRFVKVLQYDARRLWPATGKMLLFFALLPTFFWIFKIIFEPDDISDPISRFVTISILYQFVCIALPASMYETVNLPKKGIPFAMLPASTLEKFISMLLYTLIVCPTLFLIGAVAMDTIFTLLPFGGYHQGLWTVFDSDIQLNTDDSEAVGFTILSHALFLVGCSIFFFTNTLFKKSKVLNTILWLMLIGFVVFIIGGVIVVNHLTDYLEKLAVSGQDYNITVDYTISIIISCIAFIGLYTWSYFRLRKMRY